MKVLKIILFAWIIVLCIAVSGYTSFTKTAQGFISAYHYNSGSDISSSANILTDNWEVINGTWDSTIQSDNYPPSITLNSNTGEIRFNHELYSLNDEFIFQSWLTGTTIDATLDVINIRFRQQDSTNYYTVRINWDSDTNSNCTSGTCIEVGKVSGGTFTELGEAVWTPATTEKYQLAISVSGSSTTTIKVYLVERTTGTGTDDIKEYWNQSSYTSLGSPIINVSDSTSPYTTGEFRITASVTSTVLSFGNPRFYKSGGITISSLSAGQYALLCQAPEIRQSEATVSGGTYQSYLYSSTTNGANKQGQKFKFLESIDLDNATVFLRKAGSPTGSIVAKIYSDSAGLPNVVVTNGTSTSVAVSSITGGTSPFDYPQEVTFTWGTRPALTSGTDYHVIIESNGDYSANASNYLLMTVNVADKVYGNQVRNVAAGWEAVTANDIVLLLQGKEVMRASQVQSGGSATIDMTAMWMPYDAKVKVATAATDCYTALVDSTPHMETNVSGDTWTYNSGKKLSIGPFLGCPLDGSFKIWARGSDYNGGTQTYKICYDTVDTDVSVSNCEGGCSGGVCNLATGSSMTSSNDYVSTASMSSLTANTTYYYRVLIDDVVQESTPNSFISPPSNATDVDIDIGAVSCLSINQMPYDHFQNLTSVETKIFWEMGDNIYTDVPWDMFSSLTKGDYALRHRDTLLEINNNSNKQVYHCRKHDDHEWKNDAYGVTGGAQSYTGSTGNVKHFYQGSLFGMDNYVAAFNPTTITSGLYNYKSRWGKVAFISTDEIYGKDDATDTDIAYYYGQNTLTITNPGAETGDTTGWTCQDSLGGGCETFESQAITVYAGTKSFRTYDANTPIIQQAITVVTGLNYTVTAWMRNIYGSQPVTLRVRTDSYTLGSNECTTSTTSATWTQLTCSFIAGADTSLFVQQVGTGNGDNAYMDDMVILSIELTPSCTRDASIANRLNCTSTTFTTESPAISTTRGVIVFQDRMYQVSSVIDNDTLDTVENMPTGTDTATRIWKTGKQMLGRQQLFDIMDALKDYDDDSDVKAIFMMFSKPLRVASSAWPATSAHFDDWISYADQRDLILSYIKNDVTTKPIFVSGDRHKFAIYKHTNIDTNGQWEFLVGQGGAPNSVDIQTVQASDIQEEFILRRGLGLIAINTSNAIDSNPKAASTFSIRDVSGHRIYDDIGNAYEVDSRKSTHAVLNYQHTYKFARDSNGYCYALYYDGTNFIVEASDDTSCQDWNGGPTLTLTGIIFDDDNNAPSMIYYNDKLYFGYVKQASPCTGSDECSFAATSTITRTSGKPTTLGALASETNTGGATGNPVEDVQIVIGADNTLWTVFTVHTNSSGNEGSRIKMATCGTECVTSWSGNGWTSTDDVLETMEARSVVPLTTDQVLTYFTRNGTLYWSECDGSATPKCPVAASLVAVDTQGENISNSSAGGWQPQASHDGSGGIGLMYRQSTEPYSVNFRKYDGSAWGSAIAIGNTGKKNQTSPSISKVGSIFVVGWLGGSLKEIKLYRVGLSPTVAGDFTAINPIIDDGWIKSRLTMSQSNDGVSAMLYWSRMFGVNKGGFGQPLTYRQYLSLSKNPFILYKELWQEVNP